MNKKVFIGPLADSIKHWERMRAYVKTQIDTGHGDELPSSYWMRSTIHESWGGVDCPLCQACSRNSCYYLENSDNDCPLSPGISGDCCEEWEAMGKTKTWNEWYEASNSMMDRLQSELYTLEKLPNE